VRFFLALTLLAAALAAFGQSPEIQRALIQRDQQSAEFAARLRGPAAAASLEQLHARQLIDAAAPLHPDPVIARQLHPYERQKMTDERALALPAPIVRIAPLAPPLPLPGGPRHRVDPVPVQVPY
jgi:hypothetical protein